MTWLAWTAGGLLSASSIAVFSKTSMEFVQRFVHFCYDWFQFTRMSQRFYYQWLIDSAMG